MRADGSEFPVEVAITQPDVPGPPIYCGYLRDVTERREAEEALRHLAEEQAALRRVATAVAAERDPGRVFGLVTEEVGRLLGAQSSNMVRYEDDGTATVVGGWSLGARAAACPSAAGSRSTATRRPFASGAAAARPASTATTASRARWPSCCATSSASAARWPRRWCSAAACGAR